MKLSNPNMTQFSLRNPWIQKLLLIVFIVAIFWHGLWGGVPRADQWDYLYQVSRFDNLGDILLNGSSWNRTQANPGDSILYRPILFAQLGSFYYLFGYNFFLWQLASLVLHLLVVLGLYALFVQGMLKNTAYPFLLSLLFGSSLLGSELVLWQIVSGYLTFSALVICSVFCLVKYFSTKNESYAWVALLSGLISEFTYELGSFLNLLIAVSFLYNWLSIKNKRDLKWAILFLAGVLIYPILSIVDLWSLGVIFTSNLPQNSKVHDVMQSIEIHKINSVYKLLLGIWYAVVQIFYWLGGWILPAFYKVQPQGRLVFEGFKFPVLFSSLNCVAVLIIIYVSYYLVKAKEVLFYKISRPARWAGLGSFLFVFAYSFVIAYGRAVPRGLEYVITINVYYSYIFCLALMIGAALFTLNYDKNANTSGNPPSYFNLSDKGKLYLNKIIPLMLLILILLNAYYTFKIAENYHYEYSYPKQKVIDAVEEWLSAVGKAPNAYFVISENCWGNDSMEFRDRHFIEEFGWNISVNMADVLWPQKSFKLHEHDLQASQYRIFDIECPNK